MGALSQYRTWLLISAGILLLYSAFGGLKYINCIEAFKGYKDIFRDKNGKVSLRDYLFFILFPMFLASSSNLYSLIKVDMLNVICVIITIMTSMIYAFMSIIDSKYEKVVENKECPYLDYKWAQRLYGETIDIITCEIIVSVFLLILCFVQPLTNSWNKVLINFGESYISWQSIISWFIYYLFYFFILNLLVVTKRFYRFNEKK